jgi:uncharacterized protein (TIGR02145 family)
MKKLLVLLLFFACVLPLFVTGQLTGIVLTFSAEHDQQRVRLDSIYIENLSKETDTVLFFPDTVITLMYGFFGTGDFTLSDCQDLFISPNYPNPFQGQTQFYISVEKDQEVVISASDISGKRLAEFRKMMSRGHHQFEFTAERSGVYLIHLIGSGAQTTRRVICTGTSDNCKYEISYKGAQGKDLQMKFAATPDGFGFTPGDRLRFCGYAKTVPQVRGSDVIEDTPYDIRTYIFDISEGVPCRDIPQLTYEGKVYKTVQIGQQCWMKENLDLGTMIWAGQNQGNNSIIEKYCYNQDPLLCEEYGGLYQWSEMMNYAYNQGPRGICPEGWHIPSIYEWEALAEFLGGHEQAGEKLKEAGNGHWAYSDLSTGNNSSGFTGLPAGLATNYDEYWNLSKSGMFWASTYSSDPTCWLFQLSYDSASSLRNEGRYSYGRSVRCLHDRSAMPFILWVDATSISDTSAITGGNIISEGGAPVTARGVCWSLDEIPTILDAHTVDGIGAGGYTSFLDSLSPGQKYYYAAYATNAFGTSYSRIDYFTTAVIELPEVATHYIEDITTTTAVSGGTVFAWGGIVYAQGLCWDTLPDPDLNGPHTDVGTEPGGFTSEMTGLDSNTVYYVRAYATNKAGTAYGGHMMMITRSGITTGTPCPGMPTVTYEGKTYNTVQIGDQCWFKENLDVGTRVPGNVYHSDNGILEKYCFYDDDEYCEQYGGLYLWNEVMNYTTGEGARGICPEGWHIPSDGEWTQLVDYLGGEDMAGGILKETSTACWFWPNEGATDSVGFSARPGGQRLMNEVPEIGWFFAAEYDAYFWTSTDFRTSTPGYWGAYYRIMTNIYPSIGRSSNVLNIGYSVRCARDE